MTVPINWRPSENFNQRPPDVEVDMIVIHNISLPPGQFGTKRVQDFFCNQLDCDEHEYFATISDLKVSSHFLIERDGDLTQFVGCDQRAWHAGASCWQGKENCNDFSIGIELEGTDDRAYTDDQYFSLIKLVRYLKYRYPNIENERIVGHSDISPGRKTDPGRAFDWNRFKKELEAGTLDSTFYLGDSIR